MKKIGLTNLINKYIEDDYDDENINFGNKMHKIFEEYFTLKKRNFTFDSDCQRILYDYYLQFLEDYSHMKQISAEQQFSTLVNNIEIICKMDAVFVEKKDKKKIYHIIDWKFLSDLSEDRFRRISYAMNMYKYALSKTIKQKHEIKMTLVIFNKSYPMYLLFSIDDINLNKLFEYINKKYTN